MKGHWKKVRVQGGDNFSLVNLWEFLIVQAVVGQGKTFLSPIWVAGRLLPVGKCKVPLPCSGQGLQLKMNQQGVRAPPSSLPTIF